MAKEKFVLVSLNESKAKQLAQAISNDSCRKILDYLADKEATETELSKSLELPVSTVHYNLKQLMDGGLVIVDEFHYSEKGREVNHYKLANKYIIIAPKTTYGIKEKLKTILPVALLTAVGAGFIQVFSKYFGVTKQMAADVGRGAVMESDKMAATGFAEEAAPMAANAPEVVQEAADAVVAATQSPFSNIALWFLIGGIFAIVLYLLISKIREKK